MKYRHLTTLIFSFFSFTHAQVNIPGYFHQKKSFDDSLKKIIHEVGQDSAWDAGEDGVKKISFAVVGLNGKANGIFSSLIKSQPRCHQGLLPGNIVILSLYNKAALVLFPYNLKRTLNSFIMEVIRSK